MTSMRVGQAWKEDPTRLSLRPYEGTNSDLEALALVRNLTLRHTSLPYGYTDITPAEMAGYYSRGDYDLVGNTWLMFMGSSPVAAAVVYPAVLFPERPPGNFHLYVAPEYWGHGLGSRLLAHLEQAAAHRGYPVLETTIAAEDSQSTSFLISHGFKLFGHSMHLVRTALSGVAQPEPPDGYRIISLAALEEGMAYFAEAANRLGSYDPNYSLITVEQLEAQTEGGSWEPEGVFFLIDPHGRTVGVIRATHLNSDTGYLNEVRLEAASRGRGLGLLLVTSALAYLASTGCSSAELDTAGENTAAYNLALRAGFRGTHHWQHFMKRLVQPRETATDTA